MKITDAAKARGLSQRIVETWIERGYLKADVDEVNTDELDEVIRQRVSDPEVLEKLPEGEPRP